MRIERGPALPGVRPDARPDPGPRPRVVITLGDPAGVGAELVAKLVARPATREQADVVILADRGELDAGAAIAGLRLDPVTVEAATDLGPALERAGIAVLHRPIAAHGPVPRGVASAGAGRAALAHLSEAVALAAGGQADALLYAPLNKASLRAAGLPHQDEAHFFAEMLGRPGTFGEVSILGHLCTTRATSHISLREVAARITPGSVTRAIRLAHDTLRTLGLERPRIAVCGLNPHAGDGGLLGHEEIETIAPTVVALRQAGLDCEGPFAADSLFPRAWAGSHDAVVTMYHDQGQIALKAIGFHRGVTIQGGLPIPIVTPAQGSAHDIVGRNLAEPEAMIEAFRIAVALARRRIAEGRVAADPRGAVR